MKSNTVLLKILLFDETQKKKYFYSTKHKKHILGSYLFKISPQK